VHVSGDVFAHHQEHLTVFTTSGIIDECRCQAGVMDELEFIPDTRCCKYSEVLLIMGENIARNM
jgi:hypothetical protein